MKKFSHSQLMPRQTTIAILLALATIGLSLPARADQAVVNETVQNAVVTGNNNSVNQNNNTSIRNGSRGRTGDNQGTSVRTIQNADVLGDNNKVDQSNRTRVENSERRSK
jgi:hypothetical protein